MGSGGSWRVTRGARGAALAAALVALLALQPEPARVRVVEAAAPAAGHVRALVLSAQARRYLALQFRAYRTEFMGCMVGEIRGHAVFVRRIAPADVDPAQSTRTGVVPAQTCEAAGWTGTVGMIHSHPDGDRCFYYFPGTRVPSADAQSFARQPYLVDAIMCGDRVIWLGRDGVQGRTPLAAAGGERD